MHCNNNNSDPVRVNYSHPRISFSSTPSEVNIKAGKIDHAVNQSQLIMPQKPNRAPATKNRYNNNICHRNYKEHPNDPYHLKDLNPIVKKIDDLFHIQGLWQKNPACYFPCKIYIPERSALTGVLEIARYGKQVYHAHFQPENNINSALENLNLKMNDQEKELLQQKMGDFEANFAQDKIVTIKSNQNENWTIQFLKADEARVAQPIAIKKEDFPALGQ